MSIDDVERRIVDGWVDLFERRFPPVICHHGKEWRTCADCIAIIEDFNARLIAIGSGPSVSSRICPITSMFKEME